MIHQLRVIYGDTDMMGVVYYGNYLRYFESARSAWFRSVGRSYADLERLAILFPVIEAHCRYRRPAHYEDLLDIDIGPSDIKGASIRFSYTIARGGGEIAHGYTVHACTNSSGRPVRIPAELREIFESSRQDSLRGSEGS